MAARALARRPAQLGPGLVLAAFACAAAAADEVHSIQVGGVAREYVLHLPAGQRHAGLLPLVLFFHGGKSRAERMARFTGFNALADANGFVVAYPQGVDQRWNDGRGSALASADDVGFARQLIDHLVKTESVDPRRTYAAGISNGGMLVHLLGCQLPERVAAIASVAATMPGNVARSCPAAASVPALMVHGTEDPLVFWHGGTAEMRGQIGGATLPVMEAIAFWAARRGCKDPATTTTIGASTVRMEYCADVVLYKVVDGGHTWPGGPQYLPERFIGKTSRDFSATLVIWQFFAAHSRAQ